MSRVALRMVRRPDGRKKDVYDKQERDAMKRKGAEGIPAEQRVTAAANEDFNGTISGADRLTGPRNGWDPYEVWRTRVKATSRKQERARDPLR